MPSLNCSLETAATRIALLFFFWENWGCLPLAIRQKQPFSNPYIWKWAIHAWEKHPPRLQTTWNLTLTPISTSSLSASTFAFFGVTYKCWVAGNLFKLLWTWQLTILQNGPHLFGNVNQTLATPCHIQSQVLIVVFQQSLGDVEKCGGLQRLPCFTTISQPDFGISSDDKILGHQNSFDFQEDGEIL